MNTVLTELEMFHRFVGEKINNGGRTLGLEEALQAFRAYQNELERLRQEIQPALEGSQRGECRPFDSAALKARIKDQLAKKGISD